MYKLTVMSVSVNEEDLSRGLAHVKTWTSVYEPVKVVALSTKYIGWPVVAPCIDAGASVKSLERSRVVVVRVVEPIDDLAMDKICTPWKLSDVSYMLKEKTTASALNPNLGKSAQLLPSCVLIR